MKNKMILKAIIDGAVLTIVLVLLNGLESTSLMLHRNGLTALIIISAAVAILFAVIYLLMLRKETINKVIIRFSLISVLCFVITLIVVMAVCITLHISVANIFSSRELGNVDGIILLLITGTFVAVSTVVRLGILVALLIKNNRREKSGRNIRD